MPNLLKGYGALRKGRHSSLGADYLLTICLRRPSTALGREDVVKDCFAAMRRLEGEQQWSVRCAVIMPDHLHLLVTLGASENLSGAVRLFKGRLSPLLRTHDTEWQPNFYDHCLRINDDRLPVFLYIFLNPFRKKLIAADQRWAGYYCCADDWAWFGELTNETCPGPAWLS